MLVRPAHSSNAAHSMVVIQLPSVMLVVSKEPEPTDRALAVARAQRHRSKDCRVSTRSRELHIGQLQIAVCGTVLERSCADGGDAVGDRDGGQAPAVAERTNPGGADVVAYRDIREADAPIERPVPDVGDALGDRNTKP